MGIFAAVTWDPSINLGSLIAICALLFSMFGMYRGYNNKMQAMHEENQKRMNNLQFKVNLIWTEFCKRLGLDAEEIETRH